MRVTAALLTLLAGSALALPSTDHVVHEKRSSAAAFSLIKKSSAPAGHVLPIRIALVQKNLDQVPKLLDDISNPDSPNFGKHWTGDELAHHFGPSDRSIRAVKAWLADAGMRARVSANKHWIEFETSVEKAEKLLKTNFHIYGEQGGRKDHIGCDEYSLPGHISKHIDFVTPTVSTGELKRSVPLKRSTGSDAPANQQHTHFKPFETDGAFGGRTPVAGASNTSAPTISDCADSATPECIRCIYGIPTGNTSVAGNQLGIYESEDYYDQQDLDEFFTQYASSIKNGTAPTLNSIDGGLGPQNASSNSVDSQVSGESVLDLEVAFPLIHPQGVRLLQVDDPAYKQSSKHGHFDSLLDALDASFCSFMGGDNKTEDFEYPDTNQTGGYNGTKMCGTFDPPTVLSISYGYNEVMFSSAYLQRQCLEFAKLAMAGTTIVASSGDSGVSASFCANPQLHVSTPQFPASCPYVTTVGATMLSRNASSLGADDAEIAAHDGMADFSTGAGFSTIFPTPDWQKDTVSKYLKEYASPNSSEAMIPNQQFNPNGRAYPDVSAIGVNITTITNGRLFNADGTSASAPIFASLITLINEERMSSGKGPVGFINPHLYKAGSDDSIFKDVTSGRNGGCGLAGFKALKGWDPVGGWGTPKWDGLRNLLVNLP